MICSSRVGQRLRAHQRDFAAKDFDDDGARSGIGLVDDLCLRGPACFQYFLNYAALDVELRESFEVGMFAVAQAIVAGRVTDN